MSPILEEYKQTIDSVPFNNRVKQFVSEFYRHEHICSKFILEEKLTKKEKNNLLMELRQIRDIMNKMMPEYKRN